MDELRSVKIVSLPEELDCRLFIESMLNKQFLVCHEMTGGATFLVTNKKDSLRILANYVTGIGFHDAELNLNFGSKKLTYLMVFNLSKDYVFSEIYKILRGVCNFFLVSFTPVSKEYVNEAKRRVEREISSKEIRLTQSFRDKLSLTHSIQSELYYGSDERKTLLEMLDSLNNATTSNGTAYKIGIMFEKDGNESLYSYIKSKLLIMGEEELRANSISSIFAEVRKKGGIPMDTAHAALFLSFSSSIKKACIVTEGNEPPCGEITLGNYLEGGVNETSKLGIGKSTLNLGSIITGLQGTGKTFAAMHISNQLINKGVKVVVIAPTVEWNTFGGCHNMQVISLYKSKVPINFFKCDSDINIERFYENLAALLASASNAGPYTRSLEKVLLAAFHNAYKHSRAPDPVSVYEEVENAIIDQHAKRTNTAVEYTKHGENVKAALQNIRLMLMRPEFACANSADFGSLLANGAVFDLSNVSNSMKPFFYALILNQIYSIADMFDIQGNSSLRMLICLEEAQLAFSEDEQTAATSDLKQRIQDFRKKGIGLMLIAHSVMDINQSIRRLCQTKLYFRQSADVTRYAANDLLFGEECKIAITDKLKSLGHRVCAVNYVYDANGEKNLADSIFIKVPEYQTADTKSQGAVVDFENENLDMVGTSIKLLGTDRSPRANVRMEMLYVGEKIYSGVTDERGTVIVENTIEDKKYTLLVLGDRKRDTRRFDLVGGKVNEILI